MDNIRSAYTEYEIDRKIYYRATQCFGITVDNDGYTLKILKNRYGREFSTTSKTKLGLVFNLLRNLKRGCYK